MREFGIRIALGSTVRQVVGIVVGESVLLAGAGSMLGLMASIVAARAMREMLYGVQPLDIVTLVVVAGMVAVVALMAAVAPAWRAARADPQVLLRSE